MLFSYYSITMTLGDTGNHAAGNVDEDRVKQYKNSNRHEDARRRRNECSVELRKQKREQLVMKKRNIREDEDSGNEEVTSAENAGASNSASTPSRVPQKSFDEILQILRNSPTTEDLRVCFENVRRALSKSKSPPVDKVISCGLLEALICGLNVEDEKVRFECAWALTNIVSGTSEQTSAAVQKGAVGPLIMLLASPNLQLAEQCLWAIANIAGDCAQMRDVVIQHGGIDAVLYLTSVVNTLSDQFARTLAWSYSNLCRHKTPNAPLSVLSMLAKGLRTLIEHPDKIVRQDSCWAISYLTDGPDEQIKLAVDSGVMPLVLKQLSEDDNALVAPALRVLGNLATGNDQLTQVAIELGALNCLVPLVERTKSQAILKECCWLISNVVAGTHAQIQAVLDANLFPLVIDVLTKGEYKAQLEASWALANLAQGGTSEQIYQLFSDGAIEPLCEALKRGHSDFLVNILETLYALLSTLAAMPSAIFDRAKDRIEEAGGLDNLEVLQENESERVYNLAYKIIQEFFSSDDEDQFEVSNENKQPTYSF